MSVVFQDGATRVLYEPSFLCRSVASELLSWSLDSLAWQAEPTRFGGLTLRQSCAFGAPGLVYRYAGVTREGAPMPERLDALLRSELCATVPNFVLGNLYPNGAAGVGAHSDDEPDMVAGAPIACVSLGATRTFDIFDKRDGALRASVKLEHGSLLVMEGDMQDRFKHALRVERRIKAPRVSFTFRQLRSTPL